MSIITAILTADEDGSLYVSLPEELHHRCVKISVAIVDAGEFSEPLRITP